MAHQERAEKISITLPFEMLSMIKNKVDSGLYGSTSEVIREAMRLWQRQEELHDNKIKSIQNRLENSAQSGTPLPLDKAFDILEKHHNQKKK